MSKKTGQYHGKRYKKWQLAVFKRDGYRCVECGSGNNLTADHIKPRVTHPELFYDVDNGRTLCDDCRVKDMLEGWAEGKYRKGRQTVEAQI
jgi:5-methylcytosine-specific restriction endonuclease McrA